MREKPFHDRDLRISRIARRQYGVITRAQLLAIGLSTAAIGRRVAAGRLFPLHAGVYAVGHPAVTREARWLGAALACGSGAVLSHRSAGCLWGITNAEGGRPDITVPRARNPRHPRIVIHRVDLHPDELTRRRGVPVASVARVLVDLAGELDGPALTRCLREAQFLKLFDLGATRDALERRPRPALTALLPVPALTRTELEDRMIWICDRHGISRPQTQVLLCGKKVDFAWLPERVVVETDGWQGHRTHVAFQEDRTHTNSLQLLGFEVLRYTHDDLVRRPGQVAKQIRLALADPPTRVVNT